MLIKKIISYITCLALLVVILSGCGVQGNTKNNDKTNTSQESKVTDSIIINGLELKLSGFEQKKMIDENQKEIQVYTAHVFGKNVSSSEKGLGAIDFILNTDKDTEVKVTTKLSSFGSSISSGKEVKGDLYFEIPKGENPNSISYAPVDKNLYKWKIK